MIESTESVISSLFASSVIRLHKLVVFHTTREVFLSQRSRMCPRLQPILLPNRSRKATRPFLPWVMLHHILDRLFMHQVCMSTHVVEDRSQLYQLPQCSNLPTFANVLVPYHCLCYGFCLLNGSMVRLVEEVEGKQTTVEFEGHECSGDVLVCGADVVEEAGKEVCLIAEMPVGELLFEDGLT